MLFILYTLFSLVVKLYANGKKKICTQKNTRREELHRIRYDKTNGDNITLYIVFRVRVRKQRVCVKTETDVFQNKLFSFY